MMALIGKHDAVARELLAAGCDATIPDADSVTALHVAVQHGFADVLETVLDAVVADRHTFNGVGRELLNMQRKSDSATALFLAGEGGPWSVAWSCDSLMRALCVACCVLRVTRAEQHNSATCGVRSCC
jgi:ankyrin repeat protein